MPTRLVRFRSGQVRSNPLLQRKRRATAPRRTPFPVASLVQTRGRLPKLDELSGRPQRGLWSTLVHRPVRSRVRDARANRASSIDWIRNIRDNHRNDLRLTVSTTKKPIRKLAPIGGVFPRMCRAEIGIHHCIAGASLLRYAEHSSWREDNRRQSNGEPVNRPRGFVFETSQVS